MNTTSGLNPDTNATTGAALRRGTGDSTPTQFITTMLVGIFTIDSWHLANGIHCPNLLTWTADDIDTLIDKMWNRVDDCVAYDWKTGVHTQITREFIKAEFANEKYGNLRIQFTRPREGYIGIVDTDRC